MARVETIVDDLDGSTAVETVQLSLDGRDLVVDLSEANAARLRAFLAPYFEAGRRPAPPWRKPATPATPARRASPPREWHRVTPEALAELLATPDDPHNAVAKGRGQGTR